MANEPLIPAASLPTLLAQRVRLRRLTGADVAGLFMIFGDPQVARYWGHPALQSEHDAAALLAAIDRMFVEQTLFQWGIELVESAQLVGTCTLSSIDGLHRRAELGFALAQAWWGQGYMHEALECLMTHAFGALELHKLTADTDPRNAPSMRRLEALGFRRVGLFREHYLVGDEAQHAVLYELLRSESRWAATTV